MAKYCPKCGKEHINNEEYCVDCHTKLPGEKIILNDKTPRKKFNKLIKLKRKKKVIFLRKNLLLKKRLILQV